jgi:C2 domain/EF-hand domain pair
MSGSDGPLISNRSTKLKKIFSDIDANDNKLLNKGEIINYLSKKSGNLFPEELVVEMFRTVDKDSNSLMSFEEFILGYSKTEILIEKKIKDLKNDILSNTNAQTESKKQLIASKGQPKENLLTIKVISASVLNPEGLKGCLVSIMCEGEEISTNTSKPKALEWNEQFSFQITNESQDIIIQVLNASLNRKESLIGKILIPLSMLRDQQLHSEEFDIRNDTNNKITGSIKLELQWIYNLVTFLEQLIQDYDAAINEDKAELVQIEKFLNYLNIPAGQEPLKPVIKIINSSNSRIEPQTDSSIKLLVNTVLLISTISSMLRPDFFNVQCI